MRKTRVLLLTQWFDPEPTFKGLLFARELVKLGFEVEVLTGFPNYPGGRCIRGTGFDPFSARRSARSRSPEFPFIQATADP